MAEYKIDSAVASDGNRASYTVPTETTDGASLVEETRYQMHKWSTWFGIYKNIPEARMAIDTKATWTMGKGYIAGAETRALLKLQVGIGKDNFNTLLENMIRTYHIGGDSYAEIIRDNEGDVINLKVLDPSSVVIVADKKGRITRYEQMTGSGIPKKFAPHKIFHLMRNRVADEIHGQSMIEPLTEIILMRNEAMQDLKQVYHDFVTPRFIFHLNTDDEAEVAEFKAKYDAMTKDTKNKNMYVPKEAVVPETLAVANNSILNPQPWIDRLNQYFYQAAGVPQIIVGGSGEFTEATAKIAYLAWEQTVEEEQLFIEEQCESQLGISIELEFPASLEADLISDKTKDGQTPFQPNATTAGSGQ